MDHISSVNEACHTKTRSGFTVCISPGNEFSKMSVFRFKSAMKMFTSKSAAQRFTLGPTSSCHRDFFQYVTIERELKGKSHSLQIRSKKWKVSYIKSGFTVVIASQSAETSSLQQSIFAPCP